MAADDVALHTMTRQVRMPIETILDVVSGSTCYRGIATAIEIAGEDVIIIARKLPQLDIVFNKLYPQVTVQARMCHNVVLLHGDHVTLDDEL